uniref:hypothetical protein n=1 Tax=Shewanella sp. TaxID=50422 RepID=UPI004047C3B7
MEGKNWCFTDFNLHVDYSSLASSYLIYGSEVCPDSAKIHHQGYCEFETNRKLARLKKFDPSIHWERRQGNQAQAIDYCRKDGNFTEFGEKKSVAQGKRNDLTEVRQLIKEGKGMKEVVEVANSYQSIKMAEIYLKYNEKKRDYAPEVQWFFGPTGTGKTRKAVEEAGDDYYMSSRNLKWWEGYDAHENVIIDDFRKDFCTFHELLRILDRYPYRLEVKGGSRQLLAKKIWITSCFHPRDVYDTREDIEQLIRRINFISELRSEIEVQGNTNLDVSENLINI